MKKKILVLFALVLSANLHAQVTIGGLTTPKAGALLDLNSTTPGGLVLSNVDIDDLGKIPATGFVGITSAQDVNLELIGMIVYNTNTATGIGILVWNGNDWIKFCVPPAAPTGGTVSDVGNLFTFSATPAPDCTIDWYDSATSGTKVATGASSYSTTISVTTSYYAESRNTSTGCVSDSRLEVRAPYIRSVSDCDGTHSYDGSVITSANVAFINDAEYERNGRTFSAPVKIVGRNARTSNLVSTSAALVDYRDHQVSNSDATINTADYGSWFTWCMVATHADILCPSPWRVPATEDFCQYVNDSPTNTNSTNEIKSGIDGWLLGCYVYSGSVYGVGTDGYYWSSTRYGTDHGYYAKVTGSDFYPSNYNLRYGGFSLRCVKTAP